MQIKLDLIIYKTNEDAMIKLHLKPCVLQVGIKNEFILLRL